MSEAYERLATRVDDLSGRVVALPDGSVDVYYRVFEGRDRPVDARAAFGDRISDDRASSFQVVEQSREPGGQAVNAARQADALGTEVTLYGHLDAPVFEGLPFETHSMGEPATVSVFDFDDGDLMLSEESGDLRVWTPSDLRAAPDVAARLGAADAVCLSNWVSLPGMDEALRDLGPLAAGATVVFDPGDLTGCEASELVSLADGLSDLASSTPVVLSVNAGEADRLAEAIGTPARTLPDRLDAVRAWAGIAAAVVHDRDRAVMASADGTHAVPNVVTPQVVRRSGAGDRFDGGLGAGIAAGLDPATALALGNACASHYVATGETAGPEDVRAVAREMA